MELLVLLANQEGEVVSRGDILSSVWNGSSVGDDTVNVAVSQLRRALGDKPRTPEFIATVPKRGYRWIAEVKWVESGVRPSTGASQSPAIDVGDHQLPRPRRWIVGGSIALAMVLAMAVALVWHSARPESSEVMDLSDGASVLLGSELTQADSKTDMAFRSLKIRGWRLLNQRDTDSIKAARQYFQRMVGLRPDSAEAHASVSAAYSMEVDNAVGNEQRREALEPQARSSLAKAIALDSDGPTVLYARGLITLLFDRNHASALADLRLAQQKLPTNPRFSAALAWVWVAAGETARAAEVASTTLELDPTSIRSHIDLAMLLSFAGRFDEALDILGLARELDPASMAVTMSNAWVLEHAGQDQLAFETLVAGLRKQEVAVEKITALESAWKLGGLRGVLRHRAKLATVEAESGTGTWLTVGSLRSRGRDTDGAIQALQRAQQDTEGLLIYALESPDFRAIRKDSRFQVLVSQVRVSLNARADLPAVRRANQELLKR